MPNIHLNACQTGVWTTKKKKDESVEVHDLIGNISLNGVQCEIRAPQKGTIRSLYTNDAKIGVNKRVCTIFVASPPAPAPIATTAPGAPTGGDA